MYFSLYIFNFLEKCVLTVCVASQSSLLLGVTILLSMTIFLNTVQMIIPITSASPLIGKLRIREVCWSFDVLKSYNSTSN